jgi:hypothetical protein
MRSYRAFVRAAAFVLPLAVFWRCSRADDPTRATSPAATRTDVTTAADPVVVAVGDLVCGTGTPVGLPCQDAATASLVGAINPDAILLLGDNQYEKGSLADYNTFFAQTWGAYKPIIWPATGNHEYLTPDASGYFDYFNGVGVQTGRAGDRSKGYYSYNLGAWHLIVINSTCEEIGLCNAGSAQEQWLRADLAANSSMCTLAYWHHPRFSSGDHGNLAEMQATWQALYDYDADLVLSGHDHDYERFAPQTATGVLDNARGIRSFVVGTGGKELGPFDTIRPNSQLRNNTSFGVLKLTLHPASFDWQFVPIPGHTLADAGTAACHGGAPPPPPTTITLQPDADAHVLKASPNKNTGTAATLLVDASPVIRTYLRFAVAGIGSKSVVSAKLRLYVTDSSNVGGRLHRVPSTSWVETTIKWSNAPAYDALVLGTLGKVVANTWYEIDVTNQITVDGPIGFLLESSSSNGVAYRSRQAGLTTAPQLVIVVQ